MIEAILVSVNAKAQGQLKPGEVEIIISMPFESEACSEEWAAVIYTKRGADSKRRQGGPLPVVMQKVKVDSQYVIQQPDFPDVFKWSADQQGRPTRAAVFVPEFADFYGTWGHSKLELDSTLNQGWIGSQI